MLHLVDLGCQDTDWVGGNEKEVLDAILLQEINKNIFCFVFFSFVLTINGPKVAEIVPIVLQCPDTDRRC